jgi:hypothetical protein
MVLSRGLKQYAYGLAGLVACQEDSLNHHKSARREGARSLDRSLDFGPDSALR